MRIIVVILISALLWSCNSNEKPEGILSKEEMVPILIDVYVSEGRLSAMNVKRDSALKVFEAVENLIFEKYNTNDSIYRASMVYYYDRPKEMELIYEVVMDSLGLREQKLDEIETKKIEEERGGSNPTPEDDDDNKEEKE